MERTPVKNELAHASIYLSTKDSGYCGSPLDCIDDEIPFSHNGFRTFTPLKFNYNLNFDHTQSSQIGKSDIIKQLSFEDSDISHDSYNQPRSTRMHPKKDTKVTHSQGRGVRRVNFLSRLKRINCESIISDLLSYLPAEDLCSVSCVNKMWRELVLDDVKANGRRREYLKSIKAQRENRSRSPFDLKKRYARLSFLPKLVLHDITNCVQESKVSAVYNSKFDSYIREGNNVGGPLMKCPSCKYAARRKEDDEFICTTCYYTFCKKCLSPYSKYHQCPMLEVPTLLIGSRRCKRNLKRL